MSVKWIVCDVDGCITPEESCAWDLGLFNAFAERARAAARGEGTLAPLTLCTGRPQPYVEVLMKLLDIRVPAICENGAVLYTLADNHARYAAGITEEKLAGLRGLRGYIETDILSMFPGLVLQFGKEAQISVYSEAPEVFPDVMKRIEVWLHERGGPDLVINASHYYLNLSLRGIDKGAALVELLAELGTTKQEAAGIGDTEGDLPLRDAVGYFACPSNARDAIKAAADYVSPFPTLAGVLDILSRPEFQRAQ